MLDVAVATTPNVSVCSYLLHFLAMALSMEKVTYLYDLTMVR